MPSACAVPSCKTGTKSKKLKVKQRFSIFKVPNNNDLRKKWENAIPGVCSLKRSQTVCERHFEERYIVRRYIKHDNDGKIIADVPFKRPRLQLNAVPSIFNEHIKPLQAAEANENKLESIQNDCEVNELLQLPASNDDFGSIINGIEIPLQPSCENSQLFANLPMQDCNPFNSCLSEKLLTNSADFDDKNFINDDVDLFLKKAFTGNTNSTEKIEDLDDKSEILNNSNDDLFSKKAFTENTNSTEKIEGLDDKSAILNNSNENNHIIKANTEQNEETEELKATIYLKNETFGTIADIIGWDHNYSISIPKVLKYTNTVCINDKNIVLPQFWGISEIDSKNQNRIVFTYTHIETKDIASSAVLHKCVTIDFCDGQIQYFIYGRQINEPSNLSLPNIFSRNTILPILLKKFQRMHACEGIGPIDLNLIKESNEMNNTLFFGYSYHHNSCSLISLTQMCERCNKLQKTILRRHKRLLHHAKKTNDVLTTLNIIDSQKLRFLKRKLHREKEKLENVP